MRTSQRRIRGGDAFRITMNVKNRKRRADLAGIATAGMGRARNDLMPKLELADRDPRSLVFPECNVRTVDPAQVRAVSHSISVWGFVDPVLVDGDGKVIQGVVSAMAAIELALPTVPCIVVRHLSEQEQRVVRLALNRLSERGGWSLPELKAELIELIDAGIAIEDTGFTISEFDQIVLEDEVEPIQPGPLAPAHGARAVARKGDVFVFGEAHRLVCGDATDPAVVAALMREEQARLLFTDEPYNVPIAGHVTKGEHREFAMASGEMTEEQFLAFNHAWMTATLPFVCDGGLFGSFIDWRGYPTLHVAALQAGLTALNLIVWAKTNAGLGSLYRSQHELFALYKKGSAPHVNNIQLGKSGRWRSNVWNYPGASSVRSDSRKGLEFHPTVKPVEMCVDALLDLTNRGDIVLDPFLGSGSTLIAAETVGRRAFGIELDPRYVDVAVKRYQDKFGKPVTLESTGQTYEELAKHRCVGKDGTEEPPSDQG
jgi:DNA modification methylase